MPISADVAPNGHYAWTADLSFPDPASRAATMAVRSTKGCRKFYGDTV